MRPYAPPTTALTLAFSMGFALGCDDCAEGDEGCPCYDNLTCNGTLACRSQTCVSLSTSTEGSENGAGGVNLDACFSCAEGSCANEVMQCRATEGCEGFVDCVIGCGADQGCQTECVQDTSAQAQTNAVLLTACAFVACPEECVGMPATGPGGTVPGPGGPGPSPGVGPSVNPSPVAPGVVPDPQAPPPAMLSEGTNWLYLVGEGAPSTEPPNNLLGITGVFYAYGDGCAQYDFNGTTRCISGTHCAPSAANWGVGIGFDFYNDGTQKATWAAPTYAARGIAWSVSSTASFQLWLTNMDSSFGTTCAADIDCAINGPPDGYPAPGNSGTMYFTNLSKDDWGGTGTAYTFDATRILSAQFKLPSSSVEPSFELCVNQLGVIR